LEGNTITCPRHNAKFDITTGKVLSHPKMPLLHSKAKEEKIYQIVIQDENIMIEL
jgi:nitrite reductase/ring-hydroxylating ferredoxin subunit